MVDSFRDGASKAILQGFHLNIFYRYQFEFLDFMHVDFALDPKSQEFREIFITVL